MEKFLISKDKRIFSDLTSVDARRKELDLELSMIEFHMAIKKFSNNKGAGPDLIKNAFYKCSPIQFKEKVLDYLNYVWENEKAPGKWFKSETYALEKG